MQSDSKWSGKVCREVEHVFDGLSYHEVFHELSHEVKNCCLKSLKNLSIRPRDQISAIFTTLYLHHKYALARCHKFSPRPSSTSCCPSVIFESRNVSVPFSAI